MYLLISSLDPSLVYLDVGGVESEHGGEVGKSEQNTSKDTPFLLKKKVETFSDYISVVRL